MEVQNRIFNRLFPTAEVCNLNEFEFMEYSRKLNRSEYNTVTSNVFWF